MSPLSYGWGFIDGIHYTKDMHANHEREHNVSGQKRLPSVKWQSVVAFNGILANLGPSFSP